MLSVLCKPPTKPVISNSLDELLSGQWLGSSFGKGAGGRGCGKVSR